MTRRSTRKVSPRALVTGASGFVGTHLIPYLYEKGYGVWASFHQSRKTFPFPVRWIKADLTDFEETLKLVRAPKPDFIFHLAALTLPRESWKEPGRTFKVNVGGTINLLEAALRFAPKARILLVSSSHVYGRTFLRKGRVGERDVADPMTPYGVSKLLMEMAGLNFFRRHQLRLFIVRGFNQLGPAQDENFIFSDFARQIALMEKGRKSPLLEGGDLGLVRDFIHVRDAVRAYELLARRGRAGEIYNVGSGRGIRLKAAVDFLARESRIRFKIRTVPARVRKDDFPYAVGDCSKIRKLGWRPRESIWLGLKELLFEWRKKVGSNHQ